MLSGEPCCVLHAQSVEDHGRVSQMEAFPIPIQLEGYNGSKAEHRSTFVVFAIGGSQVPDFKAVSAMKVLVLF